VLLLTLWEFMRLPVLLNLGGKPPELRLISEMLDFVVEVQVIIVHVDGSDATFTLFLWSSWSMAESLATETSLRRLLRIVLRHVLKGG